MVSKMLDDVIRRKYVEFGVGADKLATTSALSNDFAAIVLRELPQDQQVDVDFVIDRTMTLRKRGASNGGLPRIG